MGVICEAGLDEGKGERNNSYLFSPLFPLISAHWYSVTVCNYALFVGWILNDGSLKEAKKYRESVLKNVRLWRDKVGAHFAQTDVRNDDSFAVCA